MKNYTKKPFVADDIHELFEEGQNDGMIEIVHKDVNIPLFNAVMTFCSLGVNHWHVWSEGNFDRGDFAGVIDWSVKMGTFKPFWDLCEQECQTTETGPVGGINFVCYSSQYCCFPKNDVMPLCLSHRTWSGREAWNLIVELDGNFRFEYYVKRPKDRTAFAFFMDNNSVRSQTWPSLLEQRHIKVIMGDEESLKSVLEDNCFHTKQLLGVYGLLTPVWNHENEILSLESKRQESLMINRNVNEYRGLMG